MDWTPSPAPEPEAGDGARGESAAVLESEVADVVFSALQHFLATHPGWNQHGLTTSALATFLFQNGCTDACVQQHYLNGLFLL